MSEESLPLRQWPAGIQQASVPANENALRVQALLSRALSVENDAPGTEYNGAVYIVGSAPTGAFATFSEHDIALFEFGSWYAWAPPLDTSMVVNDVRKVFDGTEWVDDPAGGGGGTGDVTGPASSVAGNFALFADATGKVIEDGGTPGDMAFIDDAASDGTGYVRKNGAWVAESGGGGGGMTNPMTTLGDLIAGGASGTPARLAVGTDGQVLTVVSGEPAWSAAGSGDVTGPGSSTDNALPRFDGTGGKTLQGSGVIVSDNNEISGYRGNINAQTGTTYTLQASDSGKVVECTNGSAITLTLPNSLAVGFCCTVVQGGAGQITMSPASGATLRNRQTHNKTAGQWAGATLYVRTNSGGGAAEYVLNGDTAP